MITRSELKRYGSLAQKKFRDEQGIFLVEGARAVREACQAQAGFDAVLATRRFLETGEGARLASELRARRARLEQVTERDLAAVAETVHAQGVAAVVRRERRPTERLLEPRSGQALVVALDAVADPGNLGSIIRTCDWFGVDGLMIGRGSVDLYNPKVVRATMGSLFHLPVAEDVDLGSVLPLARARGFLVLGADASGETAALDARRDIVLVFGNEAHGLSDGVRSAVEGLLAVPRYGRAESLNVGVACGVLLAQARLRIRGPRPGVSRRVAGGPAPEGA